MTNPVSTWNPARATPDAEFTYIDLSAVDQASKEITQPQQVIGSDAPSRARQLVEAGDVLVSTVRPNLNAVAQVPEDHDGATASTGFAVLRPSSSVDSRYLFQWVKAPLFVSDMTRKATGASYPAVSDRIVKESMMPLPGLAEQRRIAAILDHADALRAKRREALTRLDELTQSIFVDMFDDSAQNPMDWPVKAVTDVCNVVVDCVNRTAPVVEGPTDFKMIRTTNVKSGQVDTKSVRYVDEATYERWTRREVPVRGDVLLTREAPVGEVGMLSTDERVFLGQRLMLYRADSAKVTPRYLLAALRGSYVQRQFDRHASGSTVKHLPLPVCRSFKIQVPPLALQKVYGQRVEEVLTLTAQHRAALSELDGLFASLQSLAFRGEL